MTFLKNKQNSEATKEKICRVTKQELNSRTREKTFSFYAHTLTTLPLSTTTTATQLHLLNIKNSGKSNHKRHIALLKNGQKLRGRKTLGLSPVILVS